MGQEDETGDDKNVASEQHIECGWAIALNTLQEADEYQVERKGKAGKQKQRYALCSDNIGFGGAINEKIDNIRGEEVAQYGHNQS